MSTFPAYADDDVVVDRRWLRAPTGVFAEEAEVMAVTGRRRPPDSNVRGGQRLPNHAVRARCISWCPALR
jgi:hypothetical protein